MNWRDDYADRETRIETDFAAIPAERRKILDGLCDFHETYTELEANEKRMEKWLEQKSKWLSPEAAQKLCVETFAPDFADDLPAETMADTLAQQPKDDLEREYVARRTKMLEYRNHEELAGKKVKTEDTIQDLTGQLMEVKDIKSLSEEMKKMGEDVKAMRPQVEKTAAALVSPMAVAAMNTERKTETAQLNEKREAKRPSVAVALMRALEKEEMGKPKKGGITVRYGEDGKLSFISKHPELDQAKADVEILMFEAGVYKEAQRRHELLESALYDTVDEDRKAVLERAIWLQGWLTREVLQEINATPDHGERDYIMVLEDIKQMDREQWDKENKERAIKMAEVARIKREKEALSKQEEAAKLREIVESVKATGDRETELNRLLKDIVPQVDADRRKAQLAWIRKAEGCSSIERKAMLLKTEGMTLSEIAERLPHKNGKPMTRQGVKQALLRFEKKTGLRRLSSRGTYRQNAQSENEEKQNMQTEAIRNKLDKNDNTSADS